jgi:hypothetical protein
MNDFDDFDFAAWIAENDEPPEPPRPTAKPAAEREKHPCGECAGSGRWMHGTNRRGENKCFACKGRGYFLSSAQDRRKSRDQRRESKARKLADAKGAFNEAHPDLIVTLLSMTNWNDFAASLVDQFNRRGDLSEKQIAAAQRMIAKTKATRAANAKSRDEASTEIDLSAIKAMFEKAFRSGKRRPTYRAEGVVISRAPDHGKNAGSLYIKTAGDDYQGKITPEMVFRPNHSAAPETTAALTAIAADPQDAAVRYGRETGSCSCCGRELTDPTSIAAGIGPICEANWF